MLAAAEKIQMKTSTSINSTIPTTRLKREECKRTKHDSAFSDWKILIGPTDWEDYLWGKDGAERYRTQNLPNSTSSPGIYELGILISHSRSRTKERKLASDYIIPVYLGQADNVRNRLQQYGREGSHLEKVCSNSEQNDCKYEFARNAPGLFRDIFSRGFSIAYRWAPIENKREAEKTEVQLLNKFDYAWNKETNGQRRHNDILKKLDRYSKASQLNIILRKLHLFPRKKVGTKIKVCESHTSDNASGTFSYLEFGGRFNGILKFGRSQPRLVSLRFGVDDDDASICGVALGRGLVCRRSPVEGRKRCSEHKGMKVNGFTSNSSTIKTGGMADHSIKKGLHSDDYSYPHTTSTYPTEDKFSPVCGFIDSGGTCTKMPVQGNKRCAEHKGRRIRKAVCQPVTPEKECIVLHPVPGNISCHDASIQEQAQTFTNADDIGNKNKITCGVFLEDGTSCKRSPVQGRKRCEEHKGMRVRTAASKLFSMGIQ